MTRVVELEYLTVWPVPNPVGRARCRVIPLCHLSLITLIVRQEDLSPVSERTCTDSILGSANCKEHQRMNMNIKRGRRTDG